MSIEVKNLTHWYDPDAPYSKKAVDDVSFTIEKGEFIGLIGHTGSGKSTLIQHLNGLIRPTSGKVLYNGTDIFSKDVDLKQIRQKVGLVFQYPEHQLFEMTVRKDVEFGPRNLHLSKEEIDRRVDRALEVVGLPPETWDKSPFEISGGQKRRAAIAGVLAMEPEYLILDEPTAGLDPKGRDEILGQISYLHENLGLAVILVSHSMEDVARYVDRLIVLAEGKKRFDDTPRNVFAHAFELISIGLGVPQVTELNERLKERGFILPKTVLTVEEMKDALIAGGQIHA